MNRAQLVTEIKKLAGKEGNTDDLTPATSRGYKTIEINSIGVRYTLLDGTEQGLIPWDDVRSEFLEQIFEIFQPTKL